MQACLCKKPTKVSKPIPHYDYNAVGGLHMEFGAQDIYNFVDQEFLTYDLSNTNVTQVQVELPV